MIWVSDGGAQAVSNIANAFARTGGGLDPERAAELDSHRRCLFGFLSVVAQACSSPHYHSHTSRVGLTAHMHKGCDDEACNMLSGGHGKARPARLPASARLPQLILTPLCNLILRLGW